MNRAEVESFLKTLILGDFEETPNTSAQLVGGLVSMIPVLDQVMDLRDISGSLLRINQQGGFNHATTDQVVNLGFAAFGAVPTVGSAFKTVFKPLWRERRAAASSVNSGLQAVERMLGLQKGGAIEWVRKELLGKWSSRTTEAISWTETALSSCIELLEFIVQASGWKDWLIPDSIQAMAREILPALKGMREGLRTTMQRASNEIYELLQDLLGEQAAAVAMAVGQQAVSASATPATRSRSGHNAADTHPQGSVPPRQPEQQVQGAQRANAQRNQGPVHTAVQRTSRVIENMTARDKGLVGEHIVDYHELKRLGGAWPHDKQTAQWSPESVKKLNCDKRPINLALHDLSKVNQPGIDAVWQHGEQITVTEAKASASIGATIGMGRFKEKKGQIPILAGLSADQQLLHYLLSDSSDKRGTQTPLMQMGKAWVEDRAKREGIGATAKRLEENESWNYHRRVVLVTLESPGALAHVEAMADIHMGKPEAEVHPHTDHDVTKVWTEAAIDAVDAARYKAHKTKGSATTSTGEQPGKPAKPGKSK